MHFPIISIFIKNYNSPNEHCVETQMLTLSKERFTKIQKEAPLEFQKYFVQVTKYQAAQHCKVISSFIVSIQTVFAHRWNQTNPAKPELKSSYLWAWKLFLLDQVAEVISLRILNLEKLSLTFWKKKKKQYSDVDYREVDDATWAVLGSIRNTFSPVCGATNYPI